mgnify:CR=1 FL=1
MIFVLNLVGGISLIALMASFRVATHTVHRKVFVCRSFVFVSIRNEGVFLRDKGEIFSLRSYKSTRSYGASSSLELQYELLLKFTDDRA